MRLWVRLPIKARLTAAFAVSLAAVIGGLSVFVYVRVGGDLLSTIDAGLRSRAELVASDVRHRGPALVRIEPTLIENSEVFAQITGASGRIVQSSSVVTRQRLMTARRIRLVSRSGRSGIAERTLTGVDNVARVLAVPVTTRRGRFVVLVGVSLGDRADELSALGSTLAVAGTVATCLIALGAWLAVSGALRPVESMRRQAATISATDPGLRLPSDGGRDELTLLAGTLNQMLDRIANSVDRERQLIDRASHELRTPLAIQRMDLDLALSGPQTVAELRAALRSVSQENEQLTRLTNDILVLARARDGVLPVQLADTSLGELLDVVRRGTGRMPAARGRVNFSVTDGRVRVDPTWVAQAVGNLVDNALRHGPADGHVAVRARCDDGNLLISVEDSGTGFAHAPPGPVEPFPPSAGSSATRGSAGLGLAVVRAIAEAHGGQVSAENKHEGGARVTIRVRDGLIRP